jgi:pSer/pThr/pTyr-binding forkhead associated (FHA) protein
MDGLEYCDACGAKLPASVAPVAEVVVAEPEPAEDNTSTPVEAVVAITVPTALQPRAKLTILRGGTVGKEFPLQTGDNLVGRWDPDSGAFPEVDLEMDDPEARISRKHALIRISEQITIEDIGSLNGTFVNRGRRLEPGSPAVLHDGDEVIIGKTFFRFSGS